MPSTIELPTRASSTPPLGVRGGDRSARGGGAEWLVGPMMLLGTACAVILVGLVARGADRAFVVAVALMIALSLVWILVCVFWPGAPDRACPACGRDGLKRLDPGSTRGVVCAECGSADAERSSFLFAEEEEGAIEPMVVSERQHGRTQRR